MIVPTTTELDSVASTFKEAAGKLADLLRKQAALKSELEKTATDADAAGLSIFADALRNIAAALDTSASRCVRPTIPPIRRRRRSSKSGDEPMVS